MLPENLLKDSEATRLVDALFGGIDFLKFLFGSATHVIAQFGHTVGVVLKGQTAIGSAHLIVSGLRTDTQHLVGIVKGVALQMEQGINFGRRQAHPLGSLLQRDNLSLVYTSVGLPLTKFSILCFFF